MSYWFLIIHKHKLMHSDHITVSHCSLTVNTHMDLDKFRCILYVVWCSLRSGCRPLIKYQPTQSMFCTLFIPLARKRLIDFSLFSPESTLGTLLFWKRLIPRTETYNNVLGKLHCKCEKIALTKRGITVHHLDGLIKCGWQYVSHSWTKTLTLTHRKV